MATDLGAGLGVGAGFNQADIDKWAGTAGSATGAASGLLGAVGTAVPILGAVTGVASLGLAIGQAVGARKRAKEAEAREARLQKEREETAAKMASDAEQIAAKQQAAAQKASRKGKALPFAPQDQALADAMNIGSGNAYDQWHRDIFGG